MVNSNGASVPQQQQQQQGNRYTQSKPSNLVGSKQYMDGPPTDSCGTENIIRSKAVESLIQPIINQLNYLSVSSSSSSFSSCNSGKPAVVMDVNVPGGEYGGVKTNGRKGRSKRAHTLVESLVEAIENFLRQGSELAHEYPEMKDDIMKAIGAIRQSGNAMADASRDFANDPLCNQKRAVMIRHSRDLLSSIAALLNIADCIDTNLLLACIQLVQQDLGSLKNASNQDELTHHFKLFGAHIVDLTNLAGKKQSEIGDVKLRDELASARATLKKNTLKLLTSSKTLIRHPELSAAQSNHDCVFKEYHEALDKIHGIVTNGITSENIRHLYDEAASLSVALDELDKQIVNINMNSTAGGAGAGGNMNESRLRLKLETQLENIISAVALMADSESTRPKRRDRIVNECNVLRQALQDLLNTYANKAASHEQVIAAAGEMTKLTSNLRRHLRRAVIDHISDSFIETNLPLESMIEMGKRGDEKALQQCEQIFMDHAEKLLEVSSMACSMSANVEGIKLVRMASIQVQTLSPQVVNASRVVCSRPASKVALENMDVFKDAWLQSVKLLTESVDDITLINDFLSVSENHILDDLNRCVLAVRDHDADTLDRTAGAIRGRCARVCGVVLAECDLYEPDEVINKIVESVCVLRDQLLVSFAHSVEYAVSALTSGAAADDNGFIEASRLVYDGIHDVRNAVLMLYDASSGGGAVVGAFDDDDEDDEYNQMTSGAAAMAAEDLENAATNQASNYWSSDMHYRAENEPEPLKEDQFKNFPEEQREQIQRQLESFRQEKKNFDREVLKWDDKGNDIIVLAKQMCVIMMEMTDFTRGRGPLKTTMDIINAAKKISECGAKLDKLARDIAEECPESQSKRELDAYLKPIPLFCNQLNIASKVKANVIDVSGEPIITGLDSATSLIISAKNLMTAVVSVVKASYVASTKYMSKTGSRKPIVQWKMKAPEKKPLVITPKPQDATARVKKASQKKRVEPIRELSEFQA